MHGQDHMASKGNPVPLEAMKRKILREAMGGLWGEAKQTVA